MDKRKNILDKQHAPRVQEKEIKTRSKVFSHLSATIMTVIFVFAMSQFEFHSLKGLLVDVEFRLKMGRDPHPGISLIAYDDDSNVRYEGTSRIPAEELALLFDALAEEHPLAVAVLGPVNEKTYTDSELNLMANSFAKVPNTFIGYMDDESLGKNAPQSLLHTARYLPGFISRDTFSYGADSVSRRVMVSIEGIPTVYAKLAELYRSYSKEKDLKLSRVERIGDSVQTYIRWQGPSGTYTPVSSAAIAQKRFSPGTFTNKIVLISSTLQSKKGGDHIFTPYSRDHFSTPLLEGAAHSLATLIRDNGILRTKSLFDGALALFVGILTVNLVLFLSPGSGILLVLGEILLLFIISFVALMKYGIWMDIAHPFVIACVSYYLVIPYRLVDEYRKRWHFQEKSELMAQLETLKSNFLSLVSHDLKTPIARIQGNAELLLGESSGLSTDQKKSIDAIVHTTDDLGHYVQTVLDLTRIESSQVPVHKVSKDVNAIVREAIDSKRLMASEKNITIESELEPLFSIKFDPKLIRQVIANLVENAIKYSPANTTITLKTKEESDWVKVEIQDQGFGISQEEQEKVFSKFYRGSSPNTTDIKGTGLGLYLVKYFVELHEGFVELKSEVGKGSNFTVALPV